MMDAPRESEEPEQLLCPILRVMMRDPVFVAGSGNTYERDAIERFWHQSRQPGTGGWGAPRRDPLTNAEIANCALFTNWDKRREIQAWLASNPQQIPEGWTSRDDVTPPPTNATRDGNNNANSGGGDARGWGLGFGARARARGAFGDDDDPADGPRHLATSAVLGVAVVAALGAIFVAATHPAPRAFHPAGDGSRPVDRAGDFIPGGARFMGSAARAAAASASASPSRSRAAAAAGESAGAARFGERLYRTMTPVRPPAGSRVAARKGAGGGAVFSYRSVPPTS